MGPSIFVTAAHCGNVESQTDSVGMQFAIETGRTDANRLMLARSTFNCVALYQAFVRPGTAQDQRGEDLSVLYCPPNAQGLSPGDIFGYLDIDGRAQIADGAVLYYLFSSNNPAAGSSVPGTHAQSNPPGLVAPILAGRTPQYGQATVFSTSCLRYDSEAVGSPGRILASGSPGESGNSGCLAVDPVSFNAIVGPQSVAGGGGFAGFSCLSNGVLVDSSTVAIARWARTMFDYMYWSKVYSTMPFSVYPAGFTGITRRDGTNMGLTATAFSSPLGSWLDSEFNQVLDVQQAIEDGLGEAPRPWVNLEPSSPRRNRLWSINPLFVNSWEDWYSTKSISINKSTTSFSNLLRHQRLNLQPNTRYRISVTVSSTAQGNASPLSIGLCSIVGGACTYSANRFLPTVAGGALRVFTSRGITAVGATAVYLDIDAHSSFTGSIRKIDVVREDAVMDFDTADARFHWWDDSRGAPASMVVGGYQFSPPTTQTFYPVAGSPSASTTLDSPPVDWALYIEQNTANPTATVARSAQLALNAGRRYQMCFRHRTNVTTGSWSAIVRAKSFNGTSWSTDFTTTFSPNAVGFGVWGFSCYDFSPSDGQVSVEFAVQNLGGIVDYLIDDLSIQDVTP